MSHTYILTQNKRIETLSEKIFSIITAEEKHIYITEGLTLTIHTNKLQIGLDDIEIECPEISDEENANSNNYLILPEFLVPGRPYAIYIYIYAITIYCTNHKMGQREAAERTRERFGLKTFSHTTLGRALIRIEKRIKADEDAASGKDKEEGEGKTKGAEPQSREAVEGEPVPAARKFPTVEQTKHRRETVSAYITKAAAGIDTLINEDNQPTKQPRHSKIDLHKGPFFDACHTIVNYTYLRYNRLLL